MNLRDKLRAFFAPTRPVLVPVFFLPLWFCLAACQKTDDIGLQSQVPFNPRQDTLGFDMSVVHMPEFLWKDDLASELTGLLNVGSYLDPVFGYVEAESYFKIGLDPSILDDDNPQTNELDWPTSAQFDTLFFACRVGFANYGDGSKPITLELRQLAEPIPEEPSSTRKLAAEPTVLGSITLVPDSVEGQEVKLPITDQAFIDAWGLDSLESKRTQDQNSLIETMKGFVLTFSGDTAAIVDFQMRSSYFQYKFVNAADTTVLFRNYLRTIVNDDNYAYYNWDSQTAQEPLKGLAPGAKRPSQLGYLQGATGIYTELTLPDLTNWVATHPDKLIVKASLKLKPIGDLNSFPIVQTLSLALVNDTNVYATNGNTLNEVLLNNSGNIRGGFSKFDFVYDPSDTSYTLNITDDFERLFVKGGNTRPRLVLTKRDPNLFPQRLQFQGTGSLGKTQLEITYTDNLN